LNKVEKVHKYQTFFSKTKFETYSKILNMGMHIERLVTTYLK